MCSVFSSMSDTQVLAAMGPQVTGLLDLPEIVLAHILGFLPTSQPATDLANTRLICKALRDAALAVFHKRTLVLGSRKIQKAREAQLEGQLLGFIARNAKSWHTVSVSVDAVDQPAVLHSLVPVGARNSSLLSLTMFLSPPWPIQQVSDTLVSLTALTTICDFDADPPIAASDLATLSSLTALRSLEVSATVSGTLCLPAQSLASMQQLTSLRLSMMSPGLPRTNGYVRQFLSVPGEHLAGCTALRGLSLDGVELLGKAPATWQGLEQVFLSHAKQGQDFWSALPQLPCVTSLQAEWLDAAVERSLCSYLPTCTRLQSLHLMLSAVQALPQLPHSLTSLSLDGEAHSLRTVPLAFSLRSLELWWPSSMVWPESLSAMVHLTALHISGEGQPMLPAPLAALPALEDLRICTERLSTLPDQLACVGTLRKLVLCGVRLQAVPAVLGGGAASQLEHLSLHGRVLRNVSSEGLEVLRSLTALKCLEVFDVYGSGWNIGTLADAMRPVLPQECKLSLPDVGGDSDDDYEGGMCIDLQVA